MHSAVGTADKVRLQDNSCECWDNYSSRIWSSRDAAREQIQEANAPCWPESTLGYRQWDPGTWLNWRCELIRFVSQRAHPDAKGS